jgi:hypothetical protein
MNCAAAEAYATNIWEPTQCEAFIQQARAMCSCPQEQSSTSGGGGCQLCQDGTRMNVDDPKCQVILSSLPSYLEIGSVECQEAKAIVAAPKGCCDVYRSPPLDLHPCTLCAGGDEPTGNISEVVYDDMTCNDLLASASVLSNSSDRCYLLQLLGVEMCGCPLESLRKCSICAGSDSSPPFPETVVNIDGQTCGDLHQSVAESNELCATIQVKGFFRCGCQRLPELPHGSCSICFDPSETYIDNNFANRIGYLCSDAAIDIFAAGNNTKECLQQQAQAAVDCGCDTFPPPPSDPACTLCPGGFVPPFQHVEVPGFEGLTCGKFDKLVPTLFDGSNCNHEDLEFYRNVCGCPDEAICRLCNNGEDISDSNKTVVDINGVEHTCGELADAARYIALGANISAFQSQCQSYRNAYSYGCCPGPSIEPLAFDFPTESPSSEHTYTSNSERGISASFLVTTSLSVFCAISTSVLILG